MEAIVECMPYSFQFINQLGTEAMQAERRHVYMTPKSFIEHIQLFTLMLGNKQSDLINQRNKYERGLVKLVESASLVEIIQAEVSIKHVEVEQKKLEADQFAEIVGNERNQIALEK